MSINTDLVTTVCKIVGCCWLPHDARQRIVPKGDIAPLVTESIARLSRAKRGESRTADVAVMAVALVALGLEEAAAVDASSPGLFAKVAVWLENDFHAEELGRVWETLGRLARTAARLMATPQDRLQPEWSLVREGDPCVVPALCEDRSSGTDVVTFPLRVLHDLRVCKSRKWSSMDIYTTQDSNWTKCVAVYNPLRSAELSNVVFSGDEAWPVDSARAQHWMRELVDSATVVSVEVALPVAYEDRNNDSRMWVCVNTNERHTARSKKMLYYVLRVAGVDPSMDNPVYLVFSSVHGMCKLNKPDNSVQLRKFRNAFRNRILTVQVVLGVAARGELPAYAKAVVSMAHTRHPREWLRSADAKPVKAIVHDSIDTYVEAYKAAVRSRDCAVLRRQIVRESGVIGDTRSPRGFIFKIRGTMPQYSSVRGVLTPRTKELENLCAQWREKHMAESTEVQMRGSPFGLTTMALMVSCAPVVAPHVESLRPKKRSVRTFDSECTAAWKRVRAGSKANKTICI